MQLVSCDIAALQRFTADEHPFHGMTVAPDTDIAPRLKLGSESASGGLRKFNLGTGGGAAAAGTSGSRKTTGS